MRSTDLQQIQDLQAPVACIHLAFLQICIASILDKRKKLSNYKIIWNLRGTGAQFDYGGNKQDLLNQLYEID